MYADYLVLARSHDQVFCICNLSGCLELQSEEEEEEAEEGSKLPFYAFSSPPDECWEMTSWIRIGPQKRQMKESYHIGYIGNISRDTVIPSDIYLVL